MKNVLVIGSTGQIGSELTMFAALKTINQRLSCVLSYHTLVRVIYQCPNREVSTFL